MLQPSHRLLGLCGAALLFCISLLVTLLALLAFAQEAERNYVGRPLRLRKTSWSSCGSATDPVQLVTFTATPDPVHLPGDITLTAEVKISENLNAPIKAEVELEKSSFLGWIPIPCMDGFGSCDYDDLCALSPYDNSTCPPICVQESLPCSCPINMGTYKVDSLPITVNVEIPQWLEQGTYKAEVKFSENGNIIGCYQIETTLD